MANVIHVIDQELHTILAALRFYQEQGQCKPANRAERIQDLATNGGQLMALDDLGIDQLCERINCSEA